MKALKKAMAVLIAALMMFALALPAFAEGSDQTDATNSTYTITAPANGHTYEIYQIFTGTLHEETEGETTKQVFSNVKWGQNGKLNDNTITVGDAVPDDVLSALKTATGNNAQKLSVIKNYVDLNSNPVGEITNGESYNAEAGYYLIKDKDNTQQGKNFAYTTYIVTVVGDVTITPKTGVPTSEKKVKDNDAATNDWQDSADYSIGDEVPFQLKATLPSNYDDYKSYRLVFHDKQSDGLDFKADTVEVMVDGTKIAKANYNVKVTGLTDGDTFEIEITNLKEAAPSATKDSVVTVEYKSKLNTNAAIGATGNPNEMYLEYSNNPNGEGTGKTPKDKVIVFTYELDVTKVDGANHDTKLKDAEFKLSKGSDGDRKYATVDTNGKVTGWVDTEAEGTTLKSDAKGLFKVIGLDDGTYYLKETKAPAGYNTLTDAIKIDVKATTANGQDWTGVDAADALTNLVVTVNDSNTATQGDKATGIVSVTVENNKGAVLPGTGGIGTTIFYIVGGLLMAVAAVLLITKKRMSNK